MVVGYLLLVIGLSGLEPLPLNAGGRKARPYESLIILLRSGGVYPRQNKMGLCHCIFSGIAQFSSELWILIFTIALICSLLPYLCYAKALKYVKPSRGSILSVMEPLTAILLSTVLLSERFENLQVIGIVLALLGVLILFVNKKVVSSKMVKGLMDFFR